MCLAIPGKILSVENPVESIFRIGKVSFGGITKKINLNLVPEAEVGDHVLVHAGVAMAIVDEEEARKNLEFLDKMGELDELNPDLDL